MIYFDGIPQYGTRSLGTATRTAYGRTKHWRNVQKDIAIHKETAARECERRNQRGDIMKKDGTISVR